MKENLAWQLPLFRHLRLTAAEIQEYLQRLGLGDAETPGALIQRLKRMGLKLRDGRETAGT